MTTALHHIFEFFKVIAQDQLCTPSVQKCDRNTARVDECNLSFKFTTVPRQHFVEWSDCQKTRQESKQTNMLLLGRASARKQRGTRSKKLGATTHQKWHTDIIYETDLVKPQEMGLTFYQQIGYGVVCFGDIPAECTARVVGHDQTVLNARPSEVTLKDQGNPNGFP